VRNSWRAAVVARCNVLRVEGPNGGMVPPGPGKYRAAYEDVMSLLAMSTTAIKEVRRIEPQFSRITPDMIKRVVPASKTSFEKSK
jgi:hypothetical protein